MEKTKMKQCSLQLRFVTFLVLCITPSYVYATGPLGDYGVNGKDAAWSGAGTAIGEASGAAYQNPANILSSKRAEISVGLHASFSALNLEFENPNTNARVHSARNAQGLSLGVAIPFTGFFKRKVGFGVTLFSPPGHIVAAKVRDPEDVFWFRYDGAQDRLETGVGLAFEPWKHLSIGVGAVVGSGGGGGANLDLDLAAASFTNQTIDMALGVSAKPQAGLTLKEMKLGKSEWTLAATYRGSSYTDVGLGARVGINGADSNLWLPMYMLTNYSPETYIGALGAVLGGEESHQVELTGEFRWSRWSQAPNQFLQVEQRVSGDLTRDLGLGDAVITPAPGNNRVVPLGLRDSWSVRAGFGFRNRCNNFGFRVGYGFRQTPVPNQQGLTNVVDTQAHLLSGGLWLKVPTGPILENPMEIAFAWQSQLMAPRTMEKASQFDGVGSYSLNGMVHRPVLSLTYRFD